MVSSRYRVSSPPVNGIETVTSVVSISDDLVFNALGTLAVIAVRSVSNWSSQTSALTFHVVSLPYLAVDVGRIDQKALAADKASSERHLLVDSGGSMSIRGNMQEVYFGPKGDVWSVKKGNRVINSNTNNYRGQLIGIDKTQTLNVARRAVEEATADVREHEKDEHRLQAEHTKYGREWKEANKALKSNDSRISKLSELIEDLRAEMESSAETTIDTTEYETDVTSCQEELEKTKEEETKLKEKREELAPKLSDIKAKLEQTSARNEKILLDIEAATSEMQSFLSTQSQTQTKIDKRRKKIQKLTEALEEEQVRLEKAAAAKADALYDARLLHYRLQVRRKRQERHETNSAEAVPDESDDDDDEPSQEDLDKIDPIEKQDLKEVEYYEAKIKKAEEKVEQERKRRKVSKEDPAVAYEKYIRALESQSEFHS